MTYIEKSNIIRDILSEIFRTGKIECLNFNNILSYNFIDDDYFTIGFKIESKRLKNWRSGNFLKIFHFLKETNLKNLGQSDSIKLGRLLEELPDSELERILYLLL